MIGNPRKWMQIALFSLCFCAVWIVHTTRATAQTPHTDNLTVRVNGIRNTAGNLLVAVRRDANTVVERRAIEIDSKTLTAQTTFDNLTEGIYGVAVIHDENKNGRLDFDPMGMPLEGYGHSNNPAKRLGPPPFDETKFALTATGATIDITLIYWP